VREVRVFWFWGFDSGGIEECLRGRAGGRLEGSSSEVAGEIAEKLALVWGFNFSDS
jgi:hypothetical protein